MIEGLTRGDPGLYVLLVVALALIGLVARGVKALIEGKLMPQATVDRMVAELSERVAAQAAALEAATTLTTEQAHTIATQADALSDFGEAQRLNVRVAQALHEVTADAAGGE